MPRDQVLEQLRFTGGCEKAEDKEHSDRGCMVSRTDENMAIQLHGTVVVPALNIFQTGRPLA